ncbi:hypothetical protein PoB_006645000 [Plakobranchus ocellatus]|uniref:HTH psq-type domain-containing protein n=1 Tax=Plakobranchus ocellatus TaxID=259542 RepID=A0AAV4D7H6_9GAST|nr:hypothetical protein PoB_006645000 [Plakobranchus ocellatus]
MGPSTSSKKKHSQITTKSKKTKHDPMKMLKAVESIKTKRLSLMAASRPFGIPASTLSDQCSGRMPLEPTHFTLLSTTEEEKLKLYIFAMARCAFGLTTEVWATAKALVDLQRPPPADNADENLSSSSWQCSAVQEPLRTPNTERPPLTTSELQQDLILDLSHNSLDTQMPPHGALSIQERVLPPSGSAMVTAANPDQSSSSSKCTVIV